MTIDYNLDIQKRKAEIAKLDRALSERAVRSYNPNKSVQNAKRDLLISRESLASIKRALRLDNQTRQNIASQSVSVEAKVSAYRLAVQGQDSDLQKELANPYPSQAHVRQLHQWRENDAKMLAYWQAKQATVKDTIARQTVQRCLSQHAISDLRTQAATLQTRIAGIVGFLGSVALSHEAISAMDTLEAATAIMKEAHRREVVESRKDAKRQSDYLKWLERKRAKEAATKA